MRKCFGLFVLLILHLFGHCQTIQPAGPVNICNGSTTTLTFLNAPAGASFQWKKDGANITGATTNSYVANASGSYTVLVDTIIYGPVVVTVHNYPKADFTFSPNNQCSNVPVSFINASTGTGLTYTWSFGNPASSSNASAATNPQHTFIGTAGNSTQNFTVKLVANSFGCKDSINKPVTTKQVPGVQLGGTGAKIYNGLPYFTQCTSLASDFTFTNQSTTAGTNKNYIIKWGDGTPDFTNTSFSSVTHNYPLGNYKLEFIVAGNECSDTGRYNVFVGNNPAVGLNNPGNTFICSESSLTFPISGTTNNPPGTTYAVNFNDGSPSDIFSHPAPASVTHFFSKGSCGTTTTQGFPNSFQANIIASNPCGTSAASVVPIYVSEKTKAVIGVSPDTIICTNNDLTVSNQSGNGFGVSSDGVCTAGKGIWSIIPATGWTLTSGSFGNDFGSTDPSVWLNGSLSLFFHFTQPGTYFIKLKTGATQACGGEEAVVKICVNPTPTADFSLSTNTGCAPLNVTTTNKSNTPLCGGNTYKWSVTYSNAQGCTPDGTPAYSYTNATSDASEAPQFQFTNPGVYTVSLITTNSGGLCTSSLFSQVVTVKTKPTATITAPVAVCQNGSINPSATVNNCYATNAPSYSWNFEGGVPATSVSASPGNVQYTTAGTYTITLTITNECGATTITKTITVNPAPDVTVPANKTYCAGEQSGTIQFFSSVTNTTFAWTNSNTAIGLPASGTGDLPSFLTNNNTAAPITAIITVTPTSGCAGVSQSFTITVNPRPAKPTVVSPVVYCLNETALPLSGIAAANNVLTWYDAYPLAIGSNTPPTPSTAVAGTFVYYATQINGFSCTSDTAQIVVTVNPKLASNNVASDQTICGGSSVQPLVTAGVLSGGNGAYAYQWQQSNDGGVNWTNINGANNEAFNPGSISKDTKYRRIVTSSTCTDTSNVITIIVLGNLANTGIGAPQTICRGTQPDTLRGQTPSGGNGTFSYQWQSSSDNNNWADIPGATGSNYLPPALNSTMYYRRNVFSGECSVTSSSVEITVSQKPVLATVADVYNCNNSQTATVIFSSTPAATAYNWTNDNPTIGLAASGSGNIAPFTTSNPLQPKVPAMATIHVVPVFTNNNVSCAGDTGSFKMIVLPTINITTPPDTILCNAQIVAPYQPLPDTGSFANVFVNYSWTVSGSGITLLNGFGNAIPSYNTVNNGNSDVTATITVTPHYAFGGKTCDGLPASYKITVKPSTAPANAGRDTSLCAQPGTTLSAAFVNGTTGVWSQVSGPTATIASPTFNTTTVTGLQPAMYQFVWTQTGFASCPSTSDTVVVVNNPPLVNKIDTATLTICAGNTISIAGQPATGGGGVFQYQWQQSNDGINFTNIIGEINQSITITPLNNVWLRRFVNASPCEGYSDTVKINVQPALANNVIGKDNAICIGATALPINGSLPSGGNGLFNYEWEQSTNGGVTWTKIVGAASVDYAPGAITQTTKYRRLVSTALCSGPFSSTSNVITITVNPDAKASFLPTDTVGCAPFQLTPAIINLQTSPVNSQYLWYANNNPIGSGTTFPGYTITTENDSVFIKLKVISTFGCRNDSLTQKFKTQKRPEPSFTASDTIGCGPLPVTFTNTSTYINEFNYFWDFGNGQTSTAVQPAAITFAPNPGYGDTTYFVKLKVFSACDTLLFTRSIRVKSAPRALFTPVRTVGCSPMKAVFRNTSKGNNNTYFWDFGDGTTFSTTSTDSVEHVYNTGKVDTFYVKLKAVNECGSDSIRYAIVVSPNTIKLNVAVNGPEHFGCTPHTVAFINNSSGASTFQWNFGDGNVLSTVKNVDTVYHTYVTAGTFKISLRAFNNCSDTTTTETITVYPKPTAAFAVNNSSVCIGDALHFINLSDSATSYLWQFGDGITSTLVQPTHQYAVAGLYKVKLIIYRNNPSGSICVDSTSQQVQISSTLTGSFTASDTVSQCAPLTVSFANQNKPSVTAVWDFGDGATGSGDNVTHTYSKFGTYTVTLTVTVPGGCTYVSTKTIKVFGPGGTLQYDGGFTCGKTAVRLQAVASNTDTYVWDFGDGTTATTKDGVVYHDYASPGSYVPSVSLQNKAGCSFPVKGIDTIKVDKLDAGFITNQQASCGFTMLTFTDTSHVFFGKAVVTWNFGDGTSAVGLSINHSYTASGNYNVQMIVVSNSGCADTVNKQMNIHVNSKPVISIDAPAVGCTGKPILFNSLVQSVDALNIVEWNVSDGATATGRDFTYQFAQAGTYTIRLVVGTVNGCYDTASQAIQIDPSPAITVSNDARICLSNSTPLVASGAETYQWAPLKGLSCYTCASPIASPTETTPYVVEGKNSFGCADYDTVVVTVIQPLSLVVSSNDSICIGQSAALLVHGGTNYNWSPATGLNSTTVSNPIATPAVTTTYRVVGYDGFNCFTDTAFVTVAVGKYPTVDLGPDLNLAAGTLYPLTSTITNGPIRNWLWTPVTNLSCSNCALPTAEIKNDITYSVKVTTRYGCSASDTINIKVFCEESQVFIPNAFTPDGDGVNDVLMVRSKGVVAVKFFRIFNRWGNVVFEKSNFPPNNPAFGWDGKIHGVVGGPDVFVYTCEVVCENGTSFTYKGNVSIIK